MKPMTKDEAIANAKKSGTPLVKVKRSEINWTHPKILKEIIFEVIVKGRPPVILSTKDGNLDEASAKKLAYTIANEIVDSLKKKVAA